jgi:hypothetical protein
LDSISVPYIKEAGVIFCFYATGVLVFAYLAAFHITETEYFKGEEGVVTPKHVLAEHALDGQGSEEGVTVADRKMTSLEKETEPSASV